MLTRRLLLASAAALSCLSPAAANEPLKVVASFSILGDIVSEIGGDRVELVTLVGPNGDAHVYQPTPADAQAVAGAALIIANGLGFEGWMDRLVEASSTKAAVVTASEGVVPISFEEEEHDDHEAHHDHDDHAGHDHEEHDHGHHHEHGASDPHAWQNVTNVAIYAGNIERALIAADPEGAESYKANASAYIAQLDELDAEIRAGVAALPENQRTIVTSHDAFGYFEAAYGLRFVAPQGVSTEAEASARDVAALIAQIKDEQIGAVFVENISDPRLVERISAETGAKIGGTLYSDALSGPDGPAATYTGMMRHNLAELAGALK